MPSKTAYRVQVHVYNSVGVRVETQEVIFTTELGDAYLFLRIAADSIRRSLQSPALAVHKAHPANRIQGLAAPGPGTQFEKLNPAGQPSGLWTRVKHVESEDAKLEVYEVIDRYNQRFYIEKVGQNQWREVSPEDLFA